MWIFFIFYIVILTRINRVVGNWIHVPRVGKNPKNVKHTCEVFGLLGFWWVFGVFQGFLGFSSVFGVFLFIKFQNKKSRQNIKEKYIYYINYKI